MSDAQNDTSGACRSVTTNSGPPRVLFVFSVPALLALLASLRETADSPRAGRISKQYSVR